MEHTKPFMSFFVVLFLFCFLFLSPLVSTQLDYTYYDKTCPYLTKIVRNGVSSAITNDTRIAASLLRLHFHDCFVNGCDGSLLLDETSSVKGEKNAIPNKNSVRGFEVIDSIKSDVEKACPSTVSCTDILTLASRDAVYFTGGPFWNVPLGRRDGRTASDENGVLRQLPSPFEPLANITTKFTSKGFDLKDVVVLSGAHTIGFAQCSTFKRRLFNFDGSGNPDPTLDSSLLQNLKSACPNQDNSDSNLVALDPASSTIFDNSFFRNIVNNSGLLQSDQALMGDNSTASIVMNYVRYPLWFFRDFRASMLKMANLGVLTGHDGEIRKNCRAVN
ncbi:Peroxidase [Parasponia andersonii]|uniref:Peroxidase n=1 Tax=Parasponia andersonii TaxID=3476 RepID=A0A2P5ADG8_PARAD|nr:Peroxidase [Parasponia andersonii]